MKAMVPKGPSMSEMLRQAQKMQEDMQDKQAELDAREYEVSAGGGVVKVKINGKREGGENISYEMNLIENINNYIAR